MQVKQLLAAQRLIALLEGASLGAASARLAAAESDHDAMVVRTAVGPVIDAVLVAALGATRRAHVRLMATREEVARCRAAVLRERTLERQIELLADRADAMARKERERRHALMVLDRLALVPSQRGTSSRK